MAETLQHPAPRHETTDTRIAPVVWGGVVLAVAAALTAAVAYGVFDYLATRPVPQSNPMAAEEQQVPPEPRIEEHPTIELRDLRQAEDQRLDSYGWVDRDKGTVHIPVDRAMELQLERGFPTRKEQTK